MKNSDLQRFISLLEDKFGNSQSGEYMSFDREFDTPKIPLAEELRERFDVLVDMNAHHTAAKGVSVATCSLCGCIGGYIENPNDNTIFHYGSFGIPTIATLTKSLVTQKTSRVHFFVPGNGWGTDENGEYNLLPHEDAYRNLSPAIAHVKSMGVTCVINCYSMQEGGWNTYRGTAWVDSEGQLFAEGMAVKSSSRPKADASTKDSLQAARGTPPRPT